MPSTPDPSGATPAAVPRAADARPTGRRRPRDGWRPAPTLAPLLVAVALTAFPAGAAADAVRFGQNPAPGPLATTPEPARTPLVCVADGGVRPVAALLGRLTTSDTLTAAAGLLDGPSDHGTLVAEAVVATWPWARIASVRVFENGGATVTVVPRAIDRCVALGADVINLSMSSARPDQVYVDDLRGAVQRAHDAGVDVVLSAGNEPGPVRYPADAVADIATVVDATDGANRCAFSSTGPGVLVGAQGCPTWLPATDGSGWIPFAGTSYAVPQVAATLAAIRAYAPDLTIDQRRAVLAGMPNRVLDQAEVMQRVGRGELARVAPAPATAAEAPRPTTRDPATRRRHTVRVRGTVVGGRVTLRVSGIREGDFRIRVRLAGTRRRLYGRRAIWVLPVSAVRRGARLVVDVLSPGGRRLTGTAVTVPNVS